MTWIWSRSVLLFEELWTGEQLYSAFWTGGLRTSWRQRGGCMDTQCDWDQHQFQHKTETLHNTPRYWVQKINKKTYKTTFNNFFQSLFGDWHFSTFQEMFVFAILRYIFLCNKKKQKSEPESHTVHGDHLILRNVKVWHKSLTFVFQKLSYFPSQNKLVKKYSREIIVGSMCGAPTSKEQVKSHQNWEHSKKINQNCWFFCLDRLGKWHLFAAISCLAYKE